MNREAISHEDVLGRIKFLLVSSGQPFTPEAIHQLYPQVLRQMVDEVLQRQLAAKYKITLDPKEVDDRIASIEERNNMSKGDLFRVLEGQGVSPKVFRHQIEHVLLWGKYIERKYASQLNISPRDVERFLVRWREDHKQTQYQLAEIVLHVSPEQNPAPVLKHAHQILEWLYQGAPFGKIAQQFSQSQSREQGGILGWRGLNRIDPLLHNVIKHAVIGDFIGPLALPTAKQPSKVVILVVLDKKEPKELALQEPNAQTVEAMLRAEILERWSQKERDDLRKRSHYEIRHDAKGQPALSGS